ncbi:hypothetical protein ACWG0P_07320 [Amedibacillus sp. YH-ame6]
MPNIYVDSDGNTIDLDKLKYDLAMIYANRKFNEVNFTQPQSSRIPDYIEHVNSILENFGVAYQELCNLGEDYLINKIDITHEYKCDD